MKFIVLNCKDSEDYVTLLIIDYVCIDRLLSYCVFVYYYN